MMKRGKWLGWILTAAILVCPVWTVAEDQTSESLRKDTSMESQRLDEVVVTATRSEMAVFDAPQDVTIITSEQIMASPFERLEDILRAVPGVYNFRHFGLQTNGIVSPIIMRGVGKNRVLFLVDGVPQNDNFNNAIAWVGWGYVQKETIERIEIVEGPTSALYGSEGLGGVVNIITKKPTPQRQTSIRGEGGSGESYAGYGFYNQKINDFGLMLAGGYDRSDGFYMVDDPKSYEIERYRRVWKGLGKATYDPTENSELSFAALYYDHDMGQGREYFHNDLQLDQYWLNYTYKGDAFGFKGLAYLNHADKTAYQDSAKDNYTSPFREEKFPSTYTWGVDLQGSVTSWEWADLTVGAAFKESSWKYNEDYPSSTRDGGAKGKQQTISPFANFDFRVLDNDLIFNLGARYDWIKTLDGANWDTKPEGGIKPYNNTYESDTEGSFSPKMGVAYHPDKVTTLRASGGKGFRAPSLFELYKVHVRSGGTYYREANPDLKPEKIWSYDVGAERFILDSLWGKLTFYQSWASDLIGDRLTNSYKKGGKTYYEYVLDNISKVNIYGIEAQLQWYATNDLSFFTTYTYNISKIDEDTQNKALEGNYLPNDPRHNLHVGARYNNPNIIDASVTVNYYADIYFDNENTLSTSDYYTVDLAVARKFFNHVTAYVNVENLFNQKYPIFRSLSTSDTIDPGVLVMGGLKFEF
jgi:outer membrane receptor protein involved in Fe transport